MASSPSGCMDGMATVFRIRWLSPLKCVGSACFRARRDAPGERGCAGAADLIVRTRVALNHFLHP
jgi:hypothetical protein